MATAAKTYPYNGAETYAVKVYGHTREGLFAPAITLDTQMLKSLPLVLQQRMAQRFYAIALQAREKAQHRAPVKSGALVAGIYVTQPAATADLAKANMGGTVKGHEMHRHSKAYYGAINNAAKRLGILVPTSADHQIESSVGQELSKIIYERTQRFQAGGGGLKGVQSVLDSDDKEATYKDIVTALPFNPMGGAGLDTLFVSMGSAMYYSAWVEYGHSGAAAQPFFTEAANWMISECMKSFTSMLDGYQGMRIRSTT